MSIEQMTRRDFDRVPCRKRFNDDIGPFESLVILPTRVRWQSRVAAWFRHRMGHRNHEPAGIHDSGYRLMDFVACRGNDPVCRLSGCSDVLHIEGIGGFGMNWLERYGSVPSALPPKGWSIDCLPRSGLLRLFSLAGKRYMLVAEAALSSFEVFAEPNEESSDSMELTSTQEG